jgi:hypothetical protein
LESFWFEDAAFQIAHVHGQYLLSRSPDRAPEGWEQHRRHGWTLSVANLPVVSLENTVGDQLGWCVGYPIVADDPRPRTLAVPTGRVDSLDPDSLEAFYERVHGRYVLIVLAEKEESLYLDAFGSLGTVYSQHEPIVASTPTLLGAAYGWNLPLIRALDMPESGHWFPGTLTPRVGIRCLLPNHCLDLIDWRARRHWPRDHRDLRPSPRVADTVNTICASLTQMIASVTSHYWTYLTLTAGRDSRMILACARAQLQAISCFTFRDGQAVTVDTHTASRLARRHRLDHFFLPIRHATNEELRTWLYLTGHAVSGAAWKIHKTLMDLDPEGAVLDGIGGEVGRGFYWREGDAPATRIAASDLLNRSGLPVDGAVADDITAWLNGLAGLTAFDVLDLYYLEHRLGGWAAPAYYGNYGGFTCARYLSPFNQRAVFRGMLTLPYEYRWTKRLATDVCMNQWPELGELPFNEFTGVRSLLQKSVARGKAALYPLARPVKRHIRALLKRRRRWGDA